MDNDFHLFNVMDMSTKARSQALYDRGSLFKMRDKNNEDRLAINDYKL